MLGGNALASKEELINLGYKLKEKFQLWYELTHITEDNTKYSTEVEKSAKHQTIKVIKKYLQMGFRINFKKSGPR